ncbi:MAG: hypothetical protein KME23_20565 [Goleter apudmare HA4340-LM2]|jgi:predicted nucleic acid-binding protein|nr:hypothetical protein [Goleter apudmare HA4340-LM2]
MARITISNLSPNDDEKFIHEITLGETMRVYAGRRTRRRDARAAAQAQVQASDEELPVSFSETNATLNQWMDRLDTQIGDLRQQLGL